LGSPFAVIRPVVSPPSTDGGSSSRLNQPSPATYRARWTAAYASLIQAACSSRLTKKS
jgi:hypothetical protein